MPDLIPISEAATVAGVSEAHLRRLAPDIAGAELRAEAGAIRGRWYIPSSWARRRARSHGASKRDRVLDALAKTPTASTADLALAAGCSVSYARRVKAEQSG